MHTVDLLDEATKVALGLGYTIRREWLDGVEPGICEFGGKRWIFLDTSLNHSEQLTQLLEAIRRHPADELKCSQTLFRRIRRQQAA